MCKFMLHTYIFHYKEKNKKNKKRSEKIKMQASIDSTFLKKKLCFSPLAAPSLQNNMNSDLCVCSQCDILIHTGLE